MYLITNTIIDNMSISASSLFLVPTSWLDEFLQSHGCKWWFLIYLLEKKQSKVIHLKEKLIHSNSKIVRPFLKMNDSSGGGGGNNGANSAGCNPNVQAHLVHPQLHSANATTVQPQSQNYSKRGNFTYATARSIGDSATCSLLASASGAAGVCGVTAATSGSTSGAHISAPGNATCLPRKIFIQRDYSEGTAVKFQSKFPPELEGYIEWQHFDYLISTLNCYYDKAEAANSSTFCEGMQGTRG